MFQFTRMTGTILNAAAILMGGIVGLTASRQPSLAHQTALRILLGAFTVYAGLGATWQAVNGVFLQVLKQLTILLLALMLGNLTGKLLRIQKSLNHLGRYAKQKISGTRPAALRRSSEGFITCSILFCVTPIAVLGSLQDGFTHNFKTLAVKSVMDGLATMAFVTTFGWGAILSIIPVIACQGTLALLARLLQPYLDRKST